MEFYEKKYCLILNTKEKNWNKIIEQILYSLDKNIVNKFILFLRIFFIWAVTAKFKKIKNFLVIYDKS